MSRILQHPIRNTIILSGLTLLALAAGHWLNEQDPHVP